MGGFLGIGKSDEEKSLEAQNTLRLQEVEQSKKDTETQLAERKAKKGQQKAKIKLGTKDDEELGNDTQETTGKPKGIGVSSSLGLGSNAGNTGVQI